MAIIIIIINNCEHIYITMIMFYTDDLTCQYGDVIMSAMASQITNLTIVY